MLLGNLMMKLVGDFHIYLAGGDGAAAAARLLRVSRPVAAAGGDDGAADRQCKSCGPGSGRASRAAAQSASNRDGF